MVIVYTDRRMARHDLATIARDVIDGGATYVVLKEKDLADVERAALAARLRADIGDRLVVSGRDGRHRDGAGRVVGRACHTAADLVAAAAEGAAYATLSPVFATASKPGYGPPLGLRRLAALCAAAPLPVYALGGVDSPARVAGCVAAGAAGVAVMGAVMRAADPAAVVRSLREAACSQLSR
jgi:thiamine-phosphate pyrophosphorylase